MHFPITSPPSPPPLHPQHQRGSGAAPQTRRGGRLATQATPPASDIPFPNRTDAVPTSNGSRRRQRPLLLCCRNAGPSQRRGDAVWRPPPSRRDGHGCPRWVASQADSFRFAGTAPEHGRCGAAGGVGAASATWDDERRGGGTAKSARCTRSRWGQGGGVFWRIFGLVSTVTSLKRVTVFMLRFFWNSSVVVTFGWCSRVR